MRRWMLAAVVGPALVMGTLGAHAQGTWKKYIVKELGFAFWAPGKIETGIGTYRGAIAGPQQTQTFKLTANDIEYVLTVVPFKPGQVNSADVLGERTFTFQQHGKLVVDHWARVETGKNQVFGRKLAVELPEGKGRTLGAFYFTKDKLFSLEATVLPANGDYESSTPVRFIDSIEFNISKAGDGAIELEAPKLK
jgi:hypothetical protein